MNYCLKRLVLITEYKIQVVKALLRIIINLRLVHKKAGIRKNDNAVIIQRLAFLKKCILQLRFFCKCRNDNFVLKEKKRKTHQYGKNQKRHSKAQKRHAGSKKRRKLVVCVQITKRIGNCKQNAKRNCIPERFRNVKSHKICNLKRRRFVLNVLPQIHKKVYQHKNKRKKAESTEKNRNKTLEKIFYKFHIIFSLKQGRTTRLQCL